MVAVARYLYRCYPLTSKPPEPLPITPYRLFEGLILRLNELIKALLGAPAQPLHLARIDWNAIIFRHG